MRPVSMPPIPFQCTGKTKHRSPDFRNCDAKIVYQFDMIREISKLIKNSKLAT